MQSLSLYMHLCIFHFYFPSFVQVPISLSCFWYIFASSTFTFFNSFAQYDYYTLTFCTLLYCLFILLSLFFSLPLSLSFLSETYLIAYMYLRLSLFYLFSTFASTTFTFFSVGYIHILHSLFASVKAVQISTNQFMLRCYLHLLWYFLLHLIWLQLLQLRWI